jgi:uncharacterized protein
MLCQHVRWQRIKNSVGRPVEGEHFFNRTDELAQFIEILDEGDNISLIAPRRVGKTSLMREVSRRVQERYLCLHLDLEACRTPADFFGGFAREAAGHVSTGGRLRDLFDGLLHGVQELRAENFSLEVQRLFSTGWQDRGDRLFQRLGERETPTVLFLDEVPIFIHRLLTDERRCIHPAGVQRADEFLSWLRAVTQRYHDRLRVVVTGSIGLAPVLRRARLSATMNAYRSVELRPWDTSIARACLQALARQYGLTYESSADLRMIELLGAGIPHHVQMFFDHLRQHLRRQHAHAAFPADVERVYHERMLSSKGHPELSHYEERLGLVLDPEHLPLAMDLLTEAALERLTPRAAEQIVHHHIDQLERLGDILDILVHDGYLRQDVDGFTFESRLVRDWWKHRHAATYRPLAAP